MSLDSKTRVLVVTGQHFASQPRRVDLHFMAEALNEQGVHVDFLSLRLSRLSRFIHDGRWDYARGRSHNQWTAISPLMDEFVWVNTVHPLNLGNSSINRLTGQFFRHYGRMLPHAVKARLAGYSHILVESGISVLLLHRLRALAPNAFLIYHAADRLATIGTHPAAADHLRRHAADIDLAHIMAEAIKPDIPPGVAVLYLPHGISTALFEAATSNPYRQPRNAVSVGDMLFDEHAVSVLARTYKDWTFHLFGRLAKLAESLPNVIAHGERPFSEIVEFIKFADIGLAPYAESKNADYLSQSSLKMIQYTYCRLPIVAPHFAAAGRNHVHGYDPGTDETIKSAFSQAILQDRESIDISGVMTWREKTSLLLAAAENRGPRPTSPGVPMSNTTAFAR